MLRTYFDIVLRYRNILLFFLTAFKIYCPEHLPAIYDQFGCPNGPNGAINDCHEKIDRYLTASIFACNSRNSFNSPTLQAKFEAGEVGPIYPMEFRFRNCGGDEESGTPNHKTCHCAEGSWILGKQNLNWVEEPWKSFGQANGLNKNNNRSHLQILFSNSILTNVF